MDERSRARALRQCLALRAAQRGAARGDLAEALAAERQAILARDRADAQTVAAAAAWQDHLRNGRFDPVIAGGLADFLNERVETATEARGQSRHARETREAREIAAQDSEARFRQAGTLLDASRRALARERERRELEAVEDRVTWQWSRR